MGRRPVPRGDESVQHPLGQAYAGHVTFYVEVPDVEAALTRAAELGGTRMMGPDTVMEGVEIGLFPDPEGHTIGVIKASPQAEA